LAESVLHFANTAAPTASIRDVRTISLSVHEEDYEAFREAAARQNCSIARLVREAMAFYRAERLECRPRLTELPVLVGYRPLTPFPERAEIWDEIFSSDTVDR
jgi:hypothetical protein